jgi:hypothetical protein
MSQEELDEEARKRRKTPARFHFTAVNMYHAPLIEAGKLETTGKGGIKVMKIDILKLESQGQELGDIQSQANRKFKGLELSIQEKFKTVAFIWNRPKGLIEDPDYKAEVEKKALKDLVVRMQILDESCGVLGAYFGANTEDSSRNNYYKASSVNMEAMVKEEVEGGIIERVISQKYRPVVRKMPTKKQWYSYELVRKARKFCFLSRDL